MFAHMKLIWRLTFIQNQTSELFLQKTEGFRGRHPLSDARVLDALTSPAHVVSCTSTRWQLTSSQVDQVLAGDFQVGLATLCPDPASPSSSRFVTEPETEVPYRVRLAGCENGFVPPEAMLLDDIERVFDGEEHR